MAQFFYKILTSALWFFTPLFLLFNKKLMSRIKNERVQYKIALSKIKTNSKKVIWIHAASGGEYEQVVPVLELINRDKYFILLSFMSPTVYNKQKNTYLADATIYHPLDFYWKAKKFIKDFNPNFYILNRHDIWPNHINIAKKMNIKIVIINLNIHFKSLRFHWLLISFNKKLFLNFNKIYTGTQRLKSTISRLVNHNNIEITGDTRYNRVKNRKKKAKQDLLPNKFKTTKNIILGSIVESDYDIVFDGIHKKYPYGDSDLISENIGLIITPHEINKSIILKLKKTLLNLKIEYTLYSEIKANPSRKCNNTIIIDTVGILADLYQYARLSYIGAGFGDGVHNVLEPAVYGCLVSFGPNIYILDEAIDLHEKGLGEMVHNINDFKNYLDLIDSDEKYNEIKLKLESFVEKRTCNIEKMLQDILDEK
ncbi:MAG: hypothetical protein CMF96_07920 [Candidatus Marinimicrobia bacterium]|nr:hypothetical protein [Candidatus Neomarinimicrobiota bacterium]|tara:strand:+ start:2393 stop:3667 length:1275 start_codon:yes stop_codon:yes gene_type:complete